jgi:hypothetical protein
MPAAIGITLATWWRHPHFLQWWTDGETPAVYVLALISMVLIQILITLERPR